MTWIDLPDDEESAELARLTKRYRDQDRPTPAVMGIMKVSPRVMRAVGQMNGAVTFGGSTLGRRREEIVSTATSSINDCFY